MDAAFSNRLSIPVFGGQGSLALTPSVSVAGLHSFTSSPAANVLVSSCRAAFYGELATLDSTVCNQVDLCASDFVSIDSILRPKDDHQASNPAFAWPSLLLRQLLQYLDFLDTHSPSATSDALFKEILQCNFDRGIGVLGFSSGLLSACVVATSGDTLSFLNHAVEAFRLAIWIGIRSQIFRVQSSKDSKDERSWAIVIFDIDKTDLQKAIEQFSSIRGKHSINLTAVVDDRIFTVSGQPDDLTAFLDTMPKETVFCETKVTSLYHCAAKLQSVRDEVRADVASRKIVFPTFEDILVPIRSTSSGDPISKASDTGGAFLESIIDMILVQPVNWDLVADKVASTLPPGIQVTFLDVGLGPGLMKTLEKAITPRVGRLEILTMGSLARSSKSTPKQEPIAIVGMSVNVPGANSLDKFWEMLLNGISTISEVPGGRFSFTRGVDHDAPGRAMRTSFGNFIGNADEFDHRRRLSRFFKISPREAKNMDPQQRVLLQVAYHALEDAGYVPYASSTFNPDTFGCFIGASTHDYVQNLRHDIDVHYSTGTLSAFLSGRLSYSLGLGGPSVVVDTACSSSIVALHLACRSLMNRDCHAALAGGVNIITSPDMFIGLDRGHFLSSSGQCKPFDASADGYARGEGCGVFVLKRLSDALAEDDSILGVIRGIEVNQSSKAPSITYPHAPTQAALFKQLLMKSDIDPNSVQVVEAHGTGTQAGDVNEMESIRSVLAVDRTPNNPLYVTSVKGNIGHLEAASGSASLAKVLMMLRNQMIPQQISLQSLNPRIAPLALDHTIISKENVAWPQSQNSNARTALVNNFGAAGSNAALLVEEYIRNGPKVAAASYVFGLSAREQHSLEELRLKFVVWLKSSVIEQASLLDISYSTTARRQLYPYRLAVSAGSVHEMIKKLEDVSIFHAKEGRDGVAFVFSGQGNHYRGMASSLYATSRTFKTHFDRCDSILTAHHFSGIRWVMAENAHGDETTSNEEEVLQIATFALQYALAKLWMSWGIQPSAVVGHSLGEYAALVIAGVLSLKDGLLIVATRARLMYQRCPPMVTGMVAVSAEPAKLEAILDSTCRSSNISISCFNSPRHCTLSGPSRELEDLIIYLQKEGGISASRLQVPYGYHSSSMLPLEDELTILGAKVKTHPTRLPFISTVLGRVIMPGDQAFPSRDYFTRQCIEPVRFTEAMCSYLSNSVSSGTTTWLEISSHPSILPMLKFFPVLSDAIKLGSLRMQEDSWVSLSRTLTSFYLGSYSINWRSVFSDIGPAKCTNLPAYPFTSQRFWVPYIEETSRSLDLTQGARSTSLNQVRSFDKVAIFRTPIDQVVQYLDGHRVGDVALCPASVYMDLVVEAICQTFRLGACEDSAFEVVLDHVVFPKPLTYANISDDAELNILVDVAKQIFEVTSQVSLPQRSLAHATGHFRLVSRSTLLQNFFSLLPSLIRHVDDILDEKNKPLSETFSRRTIYQVIFPRVVDYSTDFHTIQSLSLSSNGLEAVGGMALPFSSSFEGKSISPRPLFFDTLLHVAGFLANFYGSKEHAYICNEVDAFQVSNADVPNNACYTLYCKISPFDNGTRIVAETFAFSNADPKTLIAHCAGISFQRVRLTSLEAVLTSTAQSYSSTVIYSKAAPHFLSGMAATITTIIGNACGIPPAHLSALDDLESLGIDSLMRIELAYDISDAFPGLTCRSEDLGNCKTIMDIVKTVSPLDSSSELLTSPQSSWSTAHTLVSATHSNLVRHIVSRVLGLEEGAIEDDIPLSALGLDSLSYIETINIFRKEYQLDVPRDIITAETTIRSLEYHVSGLHPSIHSFDPPKATESSLCQPHTVRPILQNPRCKSLALLQNSNSNRTPLVLIHDGSGTSTSYQRLSHLKRQVWTISNPRLAASRPWGSLLEMSQAYTEMIANELEGPVIVGGWSFGGVVAFEIAKRLPVKSLQVKGVVLIDSPCPLLKVPMPCALIDQVLDDAGSLGTDLRLICRNEFIVNAQLMHGYTPGIQRDERYPIVFLSCNEPYRNLGCDLVHPWFWERNNPSSVAQEWDKIAGHSVEILEIPGHHFSPFMPQNVGAVSSQISQACIILEA